jgi:hypothetical protein
MKDQSLETVTTIAAKLAPPASVSIANIAGYPVSNILIWLTLAYTAVLFGHKLVQIWREFRGARNVK